MTYKTSKVDLSGSVDQTLENEYNLRLNFGDERDREYAEFEKASVLIIEKYQAFIDVQYGSSSIETMDIFPAKNSDICLFFIHGGYWRALDKSMHSFLAPSFVENNISFVNVNYGLAPTYRIGDMVEQIATAVKWSKEGLKKYGVSPNKIFLCGHSAGGHLSVLSALSLIEKDVDWRMRIKGVIPISGLFDLSPLRETSINEILNFTLDDVENYSPIKKAQRYSLPTYLAVGENETSGFLKQTVDFASVLETRGIEIVMNIVPKATHFTILGALAEKNHALLNGVLTFINKYSVKR